MTPALSRRCLAIFDTLRARVGSEQAMTKALEYALDATSRRAIAAEAGDMDPKALAMLEDVAQHHKIAASVLVAKGRRTSAWVASVRQEAVYVARAVTGVSYPALGKYLNLDHSTLIAGQRRFERRLETDDLLVARVGRVVEAARETRVAA